MNRVIIYCVLIPILTSCASVRIVEEVKNPDGTYRIKLVGTPSTGGEIVDKLNERAKQLCPKYVDYSYKDITKKRFDNGPVLEAIVPCDK